MRFGVFYFMFLIGNLFFKKKNNNNNTAIIRRSLHCFLQVFMCYWKEINALAQQIQNLLTPSTPLFFNDLYDPYREGADFVRGYPFSLREGVSTAISHGLWLNIPDHDAPTQLVKPRERNTRLSLLSLLVRLAVASFIGLSLLNYDLFLFLFFWLSVLSHKMFCFNTFGNMLFCIFLNQLST